MANDDCVVVSIEASNSIEVDNTGSEADSVGKKSRSAVWKFFEKKTDTIVTCMVCSTTLQYHGGTSSMKEHLKRKHPGDNPFEPSDEKRKQSKLDVFTKNLPCSAERAGAISERVTRMIIKDLHPINIVSGEGFKI